MTSTNANGSYASVNGLNMYYEIHGAGNPLVLLHGALSAIGSSFGALLPALAKTRKVIAIEQQAHGRTADVDRPLTITQMADDTVALLQQIGIDNADIFGYSMGAGIALDIAIRYPDVVRKLIVASVTYNTDGFLPGLIAGMEQMNADAMMGSPWQEEYARIAPMPDDWGTLVAKIKHLNLNSIPNLPVSTVQSIKAPTLLIIGDSDIVRPEHAVEMFRLLGGGIPVASNGLSRSQLAILPGTSHIMVVYRADLLLPMIPQFLDAAVE